VGWRLDIHLAYLRQRCISSRKAAFSAGRNAATLLILLQATVTRLKIGIAKRNMSLHTFYYMFPVNDNAKDWERQGSQ